MIFRVRAGGGMVAGLILVGTAVAQTTFTWTGAGGNANWTTPANWLGNTTPPNDGTATIAFEPANRFDVLVDTSQNVKGLKFDFSVISGLEYVIAGTGSTTLTLGNDGLSLFSGILEELQDGPQFHEGERGVTTFAPTLGLILGAAQTWTIDNDTSLYVKGTISGTGALTLDGTGDGYIELSGNNTYSGGTTLLSGVLALEHNNALGTGALNVAGTSTLLSRSGARSILNAITITGPVLNLLSLAGDLTFSGDVTLGASTVLNNTGQLAHFTGKIGEAGGARTLSVSGTNAIVFSGENSYTGGTVATSGALIFKVPASIPATGNLSSSALGYIGAGFANNVQHDFVDRFSKAQTFGTIGFDTDPSANDPVVISGSLSLSGFNAFARFGSATRAKITGTITPAASAGYRFGGGGGTLIVDSKLSGANTTLTADSSRGTELLLQITNGGVTPNDYTGQTSATHSAIVFSTGAAPAGSTLVLGTGGYIGTQDLALLPGLWISRFDDDTITGVIGFDTDNVNNPIGVGTGITPIDLSRFTHSGTIALGTTTAAHLNGAIILPAGQTNYYLTGYKGGWLQVNTSLSGTGSVNIGDEFGNYPDFDRNDMSRMSTVFLTQANTHSGGTSLFSGRLVLGHAGALGTGALTVDGRSASYHPRLETSLTTNPTFNVDMVVRSTFDVGGVNSFTWAGSLVSGATTGQIWKHGATTLTLAGNNSAFSGGFHIAEGTIAFAHNFAAGTGPLDFGSASIVTAAFTSPTPTIGTLSSDTNTARVTLGTGTTLTVTQSADEEFGGQIQGTGGIVKAGAGTLRLNAGSSFTGGTTVTSGKLEAGATGALGSGTVTLNGSSATLSVQPGVSLANAIAFGANGGRLSGGGNFTSNVSLGANSGVAPGNSIGTLTFDHDLTWAPGGFYDFEILNVTGAPGVGWDNVQVSGTLTFTATLGTPFKLNLLSLNETGEVGGPLNFSPGQAYSWSILSASNIVGFDPNAVTINTAGFSAALNAGVFSLNASGNNLVLTFTPVPEPSTWALLLTGVGVAVFGKLRRRW